MRWAKQMFNYLSGGCNNYLAHVVDSQINILTRQLDQKTRLLTGKHRMLIKTQQPITIENRKNGRFISE